MYAVHSCVESSFIASRLIKYKGPAALLCWVRYCWGVIWLHSGPLLSKAAELCFICGSQGARPSLCTAWPFIWKRKQIWPVSLSPPLSACLSVHLSVTVAVLVFSCCLSVCHFRLSLLLLSLSLVCHLFPQLISLSLSSRTHTHFISISPTPPLS